MRLDENNPVVDLAQAEWPSRSHLFALHFSALSSPVRWTVPFRPFGGLKSIGKGKAKKWRAEKYNRTSVAAVHCCSKPVVRPPHGDGTTPTRRVGSPGTRLRLV